MDRGDVGVGEGKQGRGTTGGFRGHMGWERGGRGEREKGAKQQGAEQGTGTKRGT